MCKSFDACLLLFPMIDRGKIADGNTEEVEEDRHRWLWVCKFLILVLATDEAEVGMDDDSIGGERLLFWTGNFLCLLRGCFADDVTGKSIHSRERDISETGRLATLIVSFSL